MRKRLVLLVGLMLVMVAMFAAPAQAQHTNDCPVNTLGYVNLVLPHNYCNDSTVHNERTDSPGDNLTAIGDYNTIINIHNDFTFNPVYTFIFNL
jgi:hypothetical protein